MLKPFFTYKKEIKCILTKIYHTGYLNLAQNCSNIETLKINYFTRLSDQHLRVKLKKKIKVYNNNF